MVMDMLRGAGAAASVEESSRHRRERRCRGRCSSRLWWQRGQDAQRLRAVAAARGLGTDAVRRRAWPALLGIDGADDSEASVEHFRAAARSPAPHRDAAVVDADVARSLWHFAPRASEDELEAQRAELKELLNGVCGANAGEVHYYQGLHDVASVLLLTLGQRAAFVALERLARTHLREYVRSDLSASLVRLELLPVLLRRVCAPLAEFCFERAGAPPHFALSWIITWFAHDCRDLEIAKRCFDVFLALPEHAPLYVAAALLRRNAAKVMEGTECDAAEVHHALSSVEVFGSVSVDELANEAITLINSHPPEVLERAAAKARAASQARPRLRWESLITLRSIALSAATAVTAALAFTALDADGDGSIVDELLGGDTHLVDVVRALLLTATV
eukprot:PRCOL_00002857-RA